jgi:hypothetical protein
MGVTEQRRELRNRSVDEVLSARLASLLWSIAALESSSNSDRYLRELKTIPADYKKLASSRLGQAEEILRRGSGWDRRMVVRFTRRYHAESGETVDLARAVTRSRLYVARRLRSASFVGRMIGVVADPLEVRRMKHIVEEQSSASEDDLYVHFEMLKESYDGLAV